MFDDSAAPDFYSARTRTARKEHKCSECGRQIRPGEQYEYATGRWEFGVDSFKICAGCCWAREWLEKHCGGWCHMAVLEDLDEHRPRGQTYYRTTGGRIVDYAPDLLHLRIRGMRRKWPRGFLEACQAKERSRSELLSPQTQGAP